MLQHNFFSDSLRISAEEKKVDSDSLIPIQGKLPLHRFDLS